MKRTIFTILISVLAGGLTAFCVAKTSVSPDSGHTASNASADSGMQYRTVNLSASDYPDFTYAAESAVDAVVYVKVTIRSQRQQMQIDPFFQFFFGSPQQPREREEQGSGSGVIIRSDGYIVTNNHVVNGATKIEVTLNNNKTYEAQLIGADAATDVALLKIDESGLPTVNFGDSDRLRLGEWVLAIGSPYGLRSTITAGIVSAKGRSMSSGEEFKIESFIQTDAAVNPGNSGGALVNKAGELMGINTMIYSQTGSYSGYSFAVPANIVRKIVNDFIDFGSVRRVKLGVVVGPVNDEIAKRLKLSRIEGVYISEVSTGGSADKSGIKKDDVIVELDSVKINSVAALQEKVNSYHPGDKAEALVIRDGKTREMEIVFLDAEAVNGTVADDGSVAFYGAGLKAASKETLARLGLKSGVEIVSISEGKMLSAGASQGFVITYVNDQPVSKPQDVVEAARKSKRAVFVEGVNSNGRTGVFGFGKDE